MAEEVYFRYSLHQDFNVRKGTQIERDRELRRWLAKYLPAYMVPAFLVEMDAFPVTLNGKIDRKALPHPQLAANAQKIEIVKPQTEIEQQLAQIWSQLLGLESISIQDNFFELGGDSILAIQAIAKAWYR